MITFYKLRHATDSTKQCYVGSTKNMSTRKTAHKTECNNPNSGGYNYKVYKYIRANGGYDNWCFDVLVQKDVSKRDRYIREGILIEQHHATLNVSDPAATVNGTSTSRKRAHRKYYNAHKEKFTEYYKQRNNTINICEKCGVVYRGLNNKYIHQRTKKCQRLAQQRIQPVININGDNNTVTVTI